MLSSNSKIPLSCLWRLFLPSILFIGFILLIISMTTTSFNDILTSEKKPRTSIEVDRLSATSQPSKENMFWKNVDLMKFPFPATVEEKAKQVEVITKSIDVGGVSTFYMEAHPPMGVEASQQSVLLLHGAAFKSQTWLDLNTIHLLAAIGHHVVAVDLPGYGQTPSKLKNGEEKHYLKDLIEALKLMSVVIVSPSMSGGFSIPYLINHSKDIDGYVPIAPVSTGQIGQKGPTITTPTLILYGELDRGLGLTSLKDLSQLPNSKAVELPNAKHPAYLDQPEMFHQLLYNFMMQLKDHKQS